MPETLDEAATKDSQMAETFLQRVLDSELGQAITQVVSRLVEDDLGLRMSVEALAAGANVMLEEPCIDLTI